MKILLEKKDIESLDFHDGYALFYMNGEYVYVNENYKVVTAPFDSANRFYSGHALIGFKDGNKKDKYFYLDNQLRRSNDGWDYASNFDPNTGLAVVGTYTYHDLIGQEGWKCWYNDYFVIDNDYKIIKFGDRYSFKSKPIFDNNGVAILMEDSLVITKNGSLYTLRKVAQLAADNGLLTLETEKIVPKQKILQKGNL